MNNSIIKKLKNKIIAEEENQYDPYPDSNIKGNQKALTEAFEDRRDKFNQEYFINNDKEKARKIEQDYNNLIIKPLEEDLVKQKKDYDYKTNSKFYNLKKLLMGK